MDAAVLSALILAVGSLIAALATLRQNRKGSQATNALTERVVDREDFKEIMDRKDKDLERLDERLADLEDRYDEEKRLREEAEKQRLESDKRATRAEEKADKLARRVKQLVTVMEEHDIAVPDEPDD